MYEMPKRGPDMVFTCEFFWNPNCRARVETAIRAAKIVCFIMFFLVR